MKANVLWSATGPSTAQCSKDVNPHSIGQEPVLDAHAPSPPAAGSHARPEKTQVTITEQNFSFSLSKKVTPRAPTRTSNAEDC
jgi:hypothetical protein